MTATPLLSELFRIGMEGVPPELRGDGPVLIADGVAMPFEDLHREIRADRVRVIGLRPAHMDRLATLVRTRALALYGMQVDDLSPLRRIEGLEWLLITWNTKVTSLQPLRGMPGLTRLSISDTPKVRDLEPIASLTNLVALNYSGGIWNKNTAATLEPITRLRNLEELVLTNLKVLDGGLRPLADLPRLRALELSNQFETEDYAYLSVALPNTTCRHFAPYVRLNTKGISADTMIVGRRKPFLDSTKDAARIAKYVAAFERLQQAFRAGLAGP
jgi:hypothetical protein